MLDIDHPCSAKQSLDASSSQPSLSPKIDCFKIIQMIDSLIKGLENPNLKTIARKIKRNKLFSDIIIDTPHEMMTNAVTTPERSLVFEERPQIKSGTQSLRRKDIISIPSENHVNHSNRKIFRLANQFRPTIDRGINIHQQKKIK